MPGIPELGKLRQENGCKFKLGLHETLHLRKPKEEEMCSLLGTIRVC